MFKHYNHLGFNNPYYFDNSGKYEIQKNFPEIIKQYNGERKIDPVAVIELLSKSYILADRTIIQGIQKTPWLAKPNEQVNNWRYDQAPKHGDINIPEEEIADILFQKICTEIELYIGEKKKVGLLLSGGMDSRMVAGSLDYLIKTEKLKGLKVTGLTWGNEGTRDVVYAKEVSKRLGWQWKNYTVTAKDMLNNITETAVNGCEYSPIHLHAIPQIRDDNQDIEVILAGSYGDSVGRAEFSGWKVKNVPALLHNLSNFSHFICDDLYKNYLDDIHNDVKKYHKGDPEKNNTAQKELDYQIHYMRRMLNPCMSSLDNEHTKFHQVFTKPDVYGYMWSISVKRRTDLVYEHMYNSFSTDLSDIPWARTGLVYGAKTGNADSYLKHHHTYEQIIVDEIYHEVKNMALSSSLIKLNIFNFKSIEEVLTLVKKYPSNNIAYYEKLVWLAALAKMVNIYDIKPINENAPIKMKNHNLKIVFGYFNSNIRRKIIPVLKKYIQQYI